MKRHLYAFALLAVCQTPIALAQDVPAPVAVQKKPTVSTAALSAVQVHPEREASAAVKAKNTSRLAAETTGTVLRWGADVGTSVRKGQVLVQIDPRDAELALQQAQAGVQAALARQALAKEQLRRAKDLVAKGFFSQEALAQRQTELTMVDADVRSAQAQEAVARRQRDKTTLRAPFDALVSERLAQVGETVAPGTPLYVLVQAGADELQATIGSVDADSLRQPSSLAFHAGGQAHPVRLLRVGHVVQAPARTRQAWFTFEQAAPAPGTSGTLRWRDDRPHLPPDLMVRRQGALGIFVMSGKNQVRFIQLPNAQEGRAVPVPTNLPASTLIVTKGQSGLQDGMAVSQATAEAAR